MIYRLNHKRDQQKNKQNKTITSSTKYLYPENAHNITKLTHDQDQQIDFIKLSNILSLFHHTTLQMNNFVILCENSVGFLIKNGQNKYKFDIVTSLYIL